MNSSLHYYSAAQMQADALRDAYRNPPRKKAEAKPEPERHRSVLAQALGWVAQAGHRRENLVAVR